MEEAIRRLEASGDTDTAAEMKEMVAELREFQRNHSGNHEQQRRGEQSWDAQRENRRDQGRNESGDGDSFMERLRERRGENQEQEDRFRRGSNEREMRGDAEGFAPDFFAGMKENERRFRGLEERKRELNAEKEVVTERLERLDVDDVERKARLEAQLAKIDEALSNLNSMQLEWAAQVREMAPGTLRWLESTESRIQNIDSPIANRRKEMALERIQDLRGLLSEMPESDEQLLEELRKIVESHHLLDKNPFEANNNESNTGRIDQEAMRLRREIERLKDRLNGLEERLELIQARQDEKQP